MGSLNGPLIGVTTSEVRRAETLSQIPESEPPMHEMALGLTYMRAVEAGGGMPVVIPPLELDLVEPLLDRLDGICLSGGPDIDPAAYGEEPDEQLGPTEPDLDRFELAIASAADRRGLPMLAICRGTQALNVVRGGTLIQHLPDHQEGPDAIPHRQSNPGREPSHPVTIEPGSLLAKTIGGDRARRQLLSPSGDRSAWRRPRRHRPGRRRDDRGRRGPEPAVSDRRPVARRAAGRPPRGAGAVQRLRVRRRFRRPRRG